GFLHGFATRAPDTEIVYKCTDYYAPQHERSLRWDDPDLAIDWPLLPEQPPLLSAKDQQGQWLVDAELYP
ncbi:MAG: dTDP-4-dehydrorhamnose 3,5-epimerase family protein, partial [Pseudomonadales bacterium]|nr:dTDP-4-dehydrorhamnose 3,5-epimerase family protein [Pseudomonadales bacterium]